MNLNTAILGLGSNIEPEKNIPWARKLISEKFKILNESKFIQTKPIGITDQPDFTNGAILIHTELECAQLRSKLKEIESNMGRVQSAIKNHGPRNIDIDLLVWNDSVVDKDFYDRSFVRDFVLELSPEVKY